jgi:hypothetical protein
MAAVVAASPASAAPAGNGWSCISPFANYLNGGALADDPPAPNHILQSVAINVARADTAPLTAVPGQKLALQDLQLSLEMRDTRIAEQMYRRTGGSTSSYSGLIPWTQEANQPRNLSVRTKPEDGKQYWSYSTTANGVTTISYVQEITAPGEPPKVRAAETPHNTTWFYATPNLGLAHRYVSHTGNNHFPLNAWVTIAASNTVEGVQTLPVKGSWTINIQDATPGSPGNPANYANDAVTATVPPVVLKLPGSRWTPTGAGPVEFTIAQPGNLGIVQIESQGYDRTGYNTPLNIRPFGSVFFRAGTESYGSSNDCIPGAITVVNSQIPLNGQQGLFFLDADPNGDPLLGDPATPGAYVNQNGAQVPKGVRGRFGFAYTAPPAIATAALPAPIVQPLPQQKPVTFGKASSVKASKAGSVKLSLTNPNTAAARYKVSAKTVSKYALSKSRSKKLVTVAASKTVSLKAGASTVSLKLSKNAKTLLKARKSVKVKVTLTPVSGGSAISKTITLKRA